MLLAKLVHISCAFLTITGFLARTYLKLRAAHYLQQRWLKIVPHVIDSILLASAIVLVIQLRQYPFVVAWVTAKLLLLVVYIGCGLWTLRFARSRTQIVSGLVGACLSFSYIIAIALTKQVWPFSW
jgi:uncharacterized membrane protein SirB2